MSKAIRCAALCVRVMPGAFAECERSMIRQRVRAGLSVIKAKIECDGPFVSKVGKVRKDWADLEPRPKSLIGRGTSWLISWSAW